MNILEHQQIIILIAIEYAVIILHKEILQRLTSFVRVPCRLRIKIDMPASLCILFNLANTLTHCFLAIRTNHFINCLKVKVLYIDYRAESLKITA